MKDCFELIPATPIIRDRLAQNIHERRLLRSLLRLAIQASEFREPDKQERFPARPPEGGGR